MRFYADGRKERDFESGIAAALEAILASPQFVFRVEPASASERAALSAGDRSPERLALKRRRG